MHELHLLRVENTRETATYLLNSGIVTIGQALSNRIVVKDPDIDRHHALLRRFPSSNTSYNYEVIIGDHDGQVCHKGQPSKLKPNERVTLVTGDCITIGSTTLSYLVTNMTLAECKLYFNVQKTAQLNLDEDIRGAELSDVA